MLLGGLGCLIVAVLPNEQVRDGLPLPDIILFEK